MVTTIESFEGGSLPSHFDGDTGGLTVSSGASWSQKDGTYYVEPTDGTSNNINTTNTTIGYSNVPFGMSFQYEITTGVSFGIATTGGHTSYSGYTFVQSALSLELRRIDSGSETDIASVSNSTDGGDVITLWITTWDSNGNITGEIENHTKGTTTTISATDTTYGPGGWGLYLDDTGQYADNFRATMPDPPTMDTLQPTNVRDT